MRTGDHVRLSGGGLAPVIWAGRRRIDARRHPNPAAVWPVHVPAGAFGANVPRRDLFLSPDHAIFADDVLIPAKCLIGSGGISQVAADQIVYHHIELAEHDVILAEGLGCESFLDTGGKTRFERAGDVIHLHPEFTAGATVWETSARAPLVVTGPKLDAVRRRLTAPAAEAPRRMGGQRG